MTDDTRIYDKLESLQKTSTEIKTRLEYMPTTTQLERAIQNHVENCTVKNDITQQIKNRRKTPQNGIPIQPGYNLSHLTSVGIAGAGGGAGILYLIDVIFKIFHG